MNYYFHFFMRLSNSDGCMMLDLIIFGEAYCLLDILITHSYSTSSALTRSIYYFLCYGSLLLALVTKKIIIYLGKRGNNININSSADMQSSSLVLSMIRKYLVFDLRRAPLAWRWTNGWRRFDRTYSSPSRIQSPGDELLLSLLYDGYQQIDGCIDTQSHYLDEA